MGIVIEKLGENVSIGAFRFPDRKKPLLCVQTGNEIVGYGSFHNDESAEEFMNILSEFVGAIEKEKGE